MASALEKNRKIMAAVATIMVAAASFAAATPTGAQMKTKPAVVANVWGRTVARTNDHMMVRVSREETTDLTVYLSGFSPTDPGTDSRTGIYRITWGNGSASQDAELVVPVIGQTLHVSARELTVHALLSLSSGGSGVPFSKVTAAIGRPHTFITRGRNAGDPAASAVHVLPFFTPQFPIPQWATRLRLDVYGVVAGTPQVLLFTRNGTLIATRDAADFADFGGIDPRAWFLQAEGGEYDLAVEFECTT